MVLGKTWNKCYRIHPYEQLFKFSQIYKKMVALYNISFLIRIKDTMG